jgi:phosphatidylserine decarboxylase
LAIDGDARRVVLVQVAGMIARKITSWAGLGTRVAAGQRLGLIHFGSRTDVVLAAEEVDVLVKVGDRVMAGVSPLARFREGSRGA